MPVDRSPGPANAGATTPSAVASELSSLKKRHGVIKESCTRIETFVNNVTNVNSDIRAQLDERRARLEESIVRGVLQGAGSIRGDR
jgi:hypothetical protein